VLAADKLLEKGGRLATLSPASIDALNKALPPFWSHGNPVDVLGDAPPERYRDALSILLQDEHVDGILVLLTPQAMTQPAAVASMISQFAKSSRRKPILASWMGEESVAEGRQLLHANGIPTFDTPEEAVETYLYMYQYTRNIETLYEMPEDILVGFTPDREAVKTLFRNRAKSGRKLLTEDEAKSVLQAYGIPSVQTLTARSAVECEECAEQIGYPVVVKVLSPEITHKTDASGVMLNLKTAGEVRTAYTQILENAARHAPEATILGVTVQAMISGAGYEVFIGAKYDPLFGPAVVFGAGGTLVEFLRDRSLGLPPLTQALARRMIEDTRIFQLLKGFRDRPAANLRLLEETVVKVSLLLVDFPELVEMDINPLYLDAHSLMALDARIVIDPAKVGVLMPPGKHLIISRYPTKYNREWISEKEERILFRVIRPEDEPLWIEMLQSFSEETIRYRFFAPLSQIDHHMVIRYCHIDYDREIAIVAETVEEGKRKMIGVSRLIKEPEEGVGEFAIVVTDRWQGKGIGSQLLDSLFEVANDFRLRRIVGDVLADNIRMLTLCRHKGFRIQPGTEPDLRRVVLDL
jgi:acetyltransferase